MSSDPSGTSTLASSLVGVLHHLLKAAHLSKDGDSWQRLVFASAIPLVGSALWHFSRTVVEVSDDEQEMWIQMWLSQQTGALSRVRRLALLSPSAKQGRRNMDYHSGRRQSQAKEDDDKEEEGGRFAPPKLEFQPASGVLAWTWLGCWPVSVSSAGDSGGFDPYFGPYGRRGGGGARAGYTVTVWFAPPGTAVVRKLLLQGRDAWLAKRSKRTEIWLHEPNRHPVGFKIVTKPSRPLSSVIVEGNIKEALQQDAIHFLNAEKWYVSKGIPYRRGYLLHGPPGCGKTSLITALAGELRLPIVLVPLNDRNMDDRCLMEILSEAPKDSIVLIEDIDCALPRTTGAQSEMQLMEMRGRLPVTLSGLLNAIDGVSAQEGRLLFMTTNHIDRLDEALIRPGRVDVKLHLGKASKQGAGELYDQFFASYRDEEENPIDLHTIQKCRSEFLDKVQDKVHSFASLQGVFMAVRDNPNLVSTEMDRLLALPTSDEQDPTKDSAYDTLQVIEKKTKDALAKEKEDEETQRQSGAVVVKRILGNPGSLVHNPEQRQIMFGGFSTCGAPEKFVAAGVLYYEIEVIKAHGIPQFGFALKDGIPAGDGPSGLGVGDNSLSWAVDGMRKRKWHGAELPWKGSWKDGDVIGLAANVDEGKIAISKNGNWGKAEGADGFGVVFGDDSMKKGLYPCFTASHYTLRYCFDEEDMRHGPPPTSIWEESPEDASDEEESKDKKQSDKKESQSESHRIAQRQWREAVQIGTR